MIRIYKPEDNVQLALAESILAAHGIPYFVHNRGFGGLYPGPQIDHYNDRTIMVPPSAAEVAREVLAELLATTELEIADETEPGTSWGYKIRLVVEALVFGWFIPRTRRRKNVL
jgi:hypothetical protein